MSEVKNITAETVLSKEEKNILKAAINLAGKEGRDVSVIVQSIQKGDTMMVFAGYHPESISNPPSADELQECLNGQRLRVNRIQQETLSMLTLWLSDAWAGSEELEEWEDAFNGLLEKITDLGDELYEQGAHDGHGDAAVFSP